MAASRLTVLLSSWNYPPRRGGIEEMVRQLFEHLSRIDDVLLLTAHAVPDRSVHPRVLRSPWKGLGGYLCWLLLRLRREIRDHPDSVLLTSGAFLGCWVQMLTVGRRRPHMVVVYGSDVSYSNRWYQWYLGRFLHRATRVVAISRATREEVLRRKLADPERVVVLPPGVDPQMVELPAARVPETDLPILLFVGRVIARKGLRPFLEQCFPLIQARTPTELWVVGGEANSSLAHRPGELADIRRWLEGQKEASRVRFLGEVPDDVLRGAFQRAKLLVLPAIPVVGDVEGFGIVFLEAALFGVPAVATSLGGIPDAVVDGETGLLTEPGDWPAYADAVVRLLEDSELHSRLSDQARRRAVGSLSWPRLAARYHETLAAAEAEFNRKAEDVG